MSLTILHSFRFCHPSTVTESAQYGILTGFVLPLSASSPICTYMVTICELGRSAGWDDVLKIPVDAIIERWKAKGCQKGQSRRLKKLFADGHVVDAEMEQASGEFVTVTNVQCA